MKKFYSRNYKFNRSFENACVKNDFNKFIALMFIYFQVKTESISNIGRKNMNRKAL